MQVAVIRPAELGAGEEKRWRELQASTPLAVHPCFSLTYARAICGADENGRVAVVEDNGAICAFLPHVRSRDRIATTLGGGQTGTDGIVSSNDPIDLRTVIRRAGLRGWRFSRATVEQRPLDPYRYQRSYHREEIRFADLKGSYDEYARPLPESVVKRISRTERYRRALQREAGEVSFTWNSDDSAELSLLLKRKFGSIRKCARMAFEPLDSPADQKPGRQRRCRLLGCHQCMGKSHWGGGPLTVPANQVPSRGAVRRRMPHSTARWNTERDS